jgi:hypothetical protein
MVKVYGPGATEAATATLKVVVVVLEVIAAGLKVGVIPVGTFSTERLIVALRFPVRAIVAVMSCDPPWLIESVLLDRVTANPGVGGGGGGVPPSPPPHAARNATTVGRASRKVRGRRDTESPCVGVRAQK